MVHVCVYCDIGIMSIVSLHVSPYVHIWSVYKIKCVMHVSSGVTVSHTVARY